MVRSSVSESFDLETFEHVPAGPGIALARVAGRAEGPVGPVALLIDDGRAVHRAAPLTAPDADSGRRGISVPGAGVADPRTAWALELGDGAVVGLPRPQTRRI